jgi:hypothetical protein
MDSNRREEMIATASNVVSLDEQRKLRHSEDQQNETTQDSVSEVSCENGVCTLNWRPQRKAA